MCRARFWRTIGGDAPSKNRRDASANARQQKCCFIRAIELHLMAQPFRIDCHATFLDLEPANAALMQPLSQLSFAKGHHVQDLETSQGGMHRRTARRIVRDVSSQCRKPL